MSVLSHVRPAAEALSGDEPGLFDLPPSTYHDGHSFPGLSQSNIKMVLDDGGPARLLEHLTAPRVEKHEFDLGTSLHALLLGKGQDKIELLDFPNYTTKAAREARDEAYAAGKTPLLGHEFDRLLRAQQAFPETARALLDGGMAEIAGRAPHNGLPLRCQIDYLRDDAIVDLKTMHDASERGFMRAVADRRYYMQGAWYRRIVKAVTGETLPVFIIGVEITAPYLVRIKQLSDDYLTIGEADMDRALAIYRECSDSDMWPGYDPEPSLLNPPPWMMPATVATDTITALEAYLGDTND